MRRPGSGSKGKAKGKAKGEASRQEAKLLAFNSLATSGAPTRILRLFVKRVRSPAAHRIASLSVNLGPFMLAGTHCCYYCLLGTTAKSHTTVHRETRGCQAIGPDVLDRRHCTLTPFGLHRPYLSTSRERLRLHATQQQNTSKPHRLSPLSTTSTPTAGASS